MRPKPWRPQAACPEVPCRLAPLDHPWCVERALARTLDEGVPAAVVSPVTMGGDGLDPEFEGASWDKIREAIYA